MNTDTFGDFSYDKLYQYFELLDQQHNSELAELQKELEQLQSSSKKPQIQVCSLKVIHASYYVQNSTAC